MCKDQQNQLNDCREKLGVKTKEVVNLTETGKTKESLKEVVEQIDLDYHIEEDAVKALFPCGQELTEDESCTFAKNTQQELIKHYKHFHDIKCAQCKCTFSSLSELSNHEKTHTQGSQWYKCDFCNGYFSDKKSVLEHMKSVHSYNKESNLMGCGSCEYETNYKKELTYHILKTHSGTEPLSCKQCNYKTISKTKLEEHMEVKHSNERPVCKFYLENRCTRQECIYRHEKQESYKHKSNKQKCKRGASCYYKSQNKCFYNHSEDEVQIVSKVNWVQNENQRPHESKTHSLWCKYQEACNKISCPFRHFQNNMVIATQKKGPMFI